MANNFAKNLRHLLSVRNLKQKDFAKTIGGISSASVSSWVQGTSKPPLDKLIDIAAFFDVSIDALVLENIGDPYNRYYELMKKGQHREFEKSSHKIEQEDSIDKDQIIKLLQEKVQLLEEKLPALILKTLANPIDQINDIHNEISKNELLENLSTALSEANEFHKRENHKGEDS